MKSVSLSVLLLCALPSPTRATDLPAGATEAFASLSFQLPVELVELPTTPPQMLVAEQRARLLTFDKNNGANRSTVVLDLTDRMKPNDWMGGILAVRLDPQFAVRPDIYLFYSGKTTVRLSRFRMDLKTGIVDPATEFVILEEAVPNDFHHGGGLAFGPDGHLYVAIGDIGPQHDPGGVAQDLHSLRGKILRIDVRGDRKPYGIPRDNPFVGKDARAEIWAYGFRNVWRMSFDRKGRLWAGDVGQNDREEIDLVKRGKNYGWNLREGDAEHHPPDQPPTPTRAIRAEAPIFTYPRNVGSSVTGGFVYKGRRWPGLRGQYVFADWGSGKILTIAGNGKVTTAHRELTRMPQINSIGRGADGEPHFVSMNGHIYAFGDEPLAGDTALTTDWAQSPLLVQVRSDPGSAARAQASNLAYAIYTSGSTGKPKGVLLEHRNVSNFFTGMDAHISDRDGNVWLAVTSLSFDISVLELFWTLARGFKIVIASSDRSDLGPGGDTGLHADKGIEFSLFYFAADSDGTPGSEKYRLLIEGAKFADENGFSAVSTPERHFGGFGGLYPNPAVAGAALAMITKRVQIRAGSCVIPLHHPARVAEEWSVVDNLSDGRVGLAFASGWHPRDFLLWPDSFADKKGVMLRNIETVRKLWRGETVHFPSPVGEVAIETRPRPVQAELPVWVTAAGHPETFASAGRIGANVLTHLLGQSFDEMAAKIQAYRKAWTDAGHSGQGKVTLMLHTFVGPDASKVKEIVRQPMKNYLKSSLELIGDYAWSFPAFKKVAKDGDSLQVNFQRMSPEEMDALLEFSFERYYEQSGLFGTPEACIATIDRLKGWGIDDVACLIDFGINADTVLKHLPYLNALRIKTSTARATEVTADDYSLSTQLKRHKVTHLQCTPSMMRMLLEHPATRGALENVRHIMIGGEALPDSVVSDIASVSRTRISNMYGPTETTIWSSVDEVKVGQTVTIGRPIANTTMYVLDGQRQPVPIGAPGELYIGGDGVARGYHERADLTADRFVRDPFDNTDGARLCRTGDLVKFRDDARIEFIGRVDHQVKLRGYRIELGEIEARLSEVPGVKEAVVMVREDRPGDPRLCAYLRSGQTFDTEVLRKHLSVSLPDYMIPGAFVTLAQFPLTPNKKVDRKALPAPDATGPRAEYAAPEGNLEGDIARVFQTILGLDQVGRDDNFFQVGGHSLLAVQAHRKLREALSRDLSVTDIFRFPTARQLAAHLDDSGGESEALKQVGDRGAARRAAMMRRKRGRESEST